MLKIGEFSRISQVPVKTLRYYEELGLISPARVDAFTSYRYYRVEQLPRLNRILALKDLGFSLEEIRQVANEGVTLENLRGMLRLRQAEQAAQVADAQERLARVEARLRLIELEGLVTHYDIVIKHVEACRVAGARGVVPGYDQQGPLWAALYRGLGAQQAHFTGPCLTVYHEDELNEARIDLEVCQPYDGPPLTDPAITIHDLPAGTMACAVHHGPYATLSQAYEAALPWIEANGYRVAGPARDIYLQATGSGDQNDAACVTEVMFPVERAA